MISPGTSSHCTGWSFTFAHGKTHLVPTDMSYTVPPFYQITDAERRCLRREETNLSTHTCQKPLDDNTKLVTVMIVEILNIYS